MTQPADAWSDKDGLRWYTFQEQDYLSVTSMRKALGMPYPLHNWTLNQTFDAILRDPDVVPRGTDMDEEKDVKAARKVLRAFGTVERDSAADRGTEVHEAIATGLDVKTLPEELRPYVEQYAKAVISLGIQPLLVERQVFNKSMGYAGSFDLVARLTRVAGSPIACIDLKTGKNTYPEHALQGYSYLKGEFIAAGGAIDHAATKVFLQASQVGVLKIGPEDWHYHDIRLDKGLHGAWGAMCYLSQWLLRNPSIDTLEVKS